MDEHALLVRAMMLAANSDLFPTWEFQTLFGVDQEGVRGVATHWPNISNLNSDDVEGAALNSLNNLLGYPHGRGEWVEQQLGVKLAVLDSLWDRVAAFLGAQRTASGYPGRLR